MTLVNKLVGRAEGYNTFSYSYVMLITKLGKKMNMGFKNIIVLIGAFLLGCSLMSCAKTAPVKTHPEEGYEGGFGGNGGHIHQGKD